MATTEFATGGDHSVVRWSNQLTVETMQKTFISRFLGTGDDAVLRFHRDLVRGAGDTIHVPLLVQDRSEMRAGDNELTNFETPLTLYDDTLKIDQGRKAHEKRGMSQQRVNFNLDDAARGSLSRYWAYVFDSMMFMYLAGDQGDVASNPECASNYLGVDGTWAGNSLRAPDAAHVYDPSATAALAHVNHLVYLAKTVNPRVEPASFEGRQYYALVLHPRTVRNLRNEMSASAINWTTIQQYLGPRAALSPVFTGAMGVINQCVIYESEYIPVQAATPYVWNVLLGRGAGHFAVGNAWGAGTSKPAMFKRTEETRDHQNIKSIGSTCIFGMQAAQWNSARHGCIVYKTDDASTPA